DFDNACNVKQNYRVTEHNAYPTAEADRYMNQIGYSRFGSRKGRELASAGWCEFRVDG
ncbi:hypothetical protein K503DRAFT_771948, partial [Rhizopogon vinicolor AM-OR11-026]